MTKGIIVIGPESTGTRFVTHLFMLAGCDGDYTHEQRFDTCLPYHDRPIVWRRSVPHGQITAPSIRTMKAHLIKGGYNDITVIVTVRNWYATKKSQVSDGHVHNQEIAEHRLRVAYTEIFRQIEHLNVAFYVLTYESIVLCPKSFNVLAKELGLNQIENIEQYIQDGNAKWFNEKEML